MAGQNISAKMCQKTQQSQLTVVSELYFLLLLFNILKHSHSACSLSAKGAHVRSKSVAFCYLPSESQLDNKFGFVQFGCVYTESYGQSLFRSKPGVDGNALIFFWSFNQKGVRTFKMFYYLELF